MKSSLSRLTLTSRNESRHTTSLKSMTIRAERSLILAHLQDQIAICTDKYENQKRRSIMTEQNFEEVNKEHSQMLAKLAKLKKKQGSSEALQLRTKVQSLELSVQQAIEKHDELLAANCRLKAQVNQRRMDRKNLAQKQKSLCSQLQSLTSELSHLKMSNSSASETINNQRFLLHNIIYQNDQQKDRYRQKLVAESQTLPEKLKSVHVKEEVQVVDCLTLVKLRLRKLLMGNRQIAKQADVYEKILGTVDKQFQVIMERGSLDGLNEVVQEFTRADQRNVAINDYMSDLSQKAESLYQDSTKLKEAIDEQEKILKRLQQQQSCKSFESSQQSNFYQNSMSKSRIAIDRISTLTQILTPVVESFLCSVGNIFCPPQKLSECTLHEKLSLVENHLNYFLERHISTQNREPTATTEKQTRIRREAPLLDVSQNQDKSLMGASQLKEYANRALTKRLLDKSQRLIANVNVSWVKDAPMSS